MRAAVYRNIESTNTLLGLAFPSEVLIVLAVFWTGMLTTTPGLAALVTLAAYVFLRVSTIGRPPQFLQHYVLFLMRRARGGGRLAAAARAAAQPRFPFARYEFRDLPYAQVSHSSHRVARDPRAEAAR